MYKYTQVCYFSKNWIKVMFQLLAIYRAFFSCAAICRFEKICVIALHNTDNKWAFPRKVKLCMFSLVFSS